MKASINLVSKRRRESAFHKRLSLFAMIFFSITFVIAASLIAYRFFLVNALATVTQEGTNITARINSDPEKKIKYLTVRERLAESEKIIRRRAEVNARMQTVTDVVPSDVTVDSIEGDEEAVSVRLVASDLASLNELIDTKIEEYAAERQSGVKRIELSGFTLNPDSLEYQASFTIEFI